MWIHVSLEDYITKADLIISGEISDIEYTKYKEEYLGDEKYLSFYRGIAYVTISDILKGKPVTSYIKLKIHSAISSGLGTAHKYKSGVKGVWLLTKLGENIYTANHPTSFCPLYTASGIKKWIKGKKLSGSVDDMLFKIKSKIIDNKISEARNIFRKLIEKHKVIPYHEDIANTILKLQSNESDKMKSLIVITEALSKITDIKSHKEYLSIYAEKCLALTGFYSNSSNEKIGEKNKDYYFNKAKWAYEILLKNSIKWEDYRSMGLIHSFHLKDYNKSIFYMDKALAIIKGNKYHRAELYYYKAQLFEKLMKFNLSLVNYSKAYIMLEDDSKLKKSIDDKITSIKKHIKK